jgi:hypothetical protein
LQSGPFGIRKWPNADSDLSVSTQTISLWRSLGIALDENASDHSTISRTRRLTDVESHAEVFARVVGLFAGRGLLQGKQIGSDIFPRMCIGRLTQVVSWKDCRKCQTAAATPAEAVELLTR